MNRAGDKIGPYTLDRKLGRGTFGVVWLAEKRTTLASTKVALKLPNDDDIDLEAVKREASVWVEASGHTNVLPIIEADIYDEQVVIVSEYAPDGSLADWLKEHGGRAPTIEAAVEMTLGILDGLSHLHARRIIHRDLKPANILLQGRTPRLVDFGLARVLKTTAQSSNVSGTYAYMPPEAFDGKRSEQTDVWSAGVILYQMLTGSLPYPQTDDAALIGALLTREPEPPPDDLPQALREVLIHSLQKNPANRYQAVAEMHEALREAAREKRVAPLETVLLPTKLTPALSQPFPPTTVRESDSFKRESHQVKTTVASYMTNRVGIDFVYVPAGSFMMGSDKYDSEKPIHQVTIREGYYMGKYEVTQAQWQKVMGSNPSYFKDCDQCPVETVSWNDAQEFVKKLNAQNDGYTYRLPSEAEWEYACRAGTRGDHAGDLDSMAWYHNNSGDKTHSVGQKQTNAFGLYDMHGNVWEWCEDVWHENYNGAPTDGSAWISEGDTSQRVVRGGSWYFHDNFLRSAYRFGSDSGKQGKGAFGVRVVAVARSS